MKNPAQARLVVRLLPLLGLPSFLFAALDRPWQQLTNPTAAEAAAIFAAPPPEYSAQFTWGWGGHVDREVIARDLDGMKALHVNAAIIEPKAGMKEPYLSPGYFELVRIAVEEARKRDMRLWIMDDGDYPSGLAGGKFSEERPDLRMQVLVAPERITVTGGTLFTHELTPDVISAVATNVANHATQVLPLSGPRLEWKVPAGDWEVALAKSAFRSLPTRSANSPTGAKDLMHSLMDYLSPTATKLFTEWNFDRYQQVVGDEFGKTILGFRGDEPAFVPNPWTPKLFDEFQHRKGYDLRPYLAAFSGTAPGKAVLTDEQRRVYADYCDVWSDLFRDSYFNTEAQWCADHGVEMQLHIEHEDMLPQLASADGDYFKDFRNIQMPGIDIIWHQIWMDNPADFPKLASSAAHLYGHPRAMCEAFAAYIPAPNLPQARWLLDFLMSRGISHIEYMFWPASVARGAPPPTPVAAPVDAASPAPAPTPARVRSGGGGGNRYYRDPGFPAVVDYVNRLSYLLGEGRPAAQIGLYIPSSSFWLTDADGAHEINHRLLTVAHQLIEQQRDFDFVDEQALSSVLKLKGDRLVNLSGQGYRAIIVPPAAAISQAALKKLQIFAKAGGRVIFLGAAPGLVMDKNFLTATGPANISWATFHDDAAALTPAVLAQLPAPDLALAQPNPLVSYNHRSLRDSDVYFIFNSGDKPASLDAALAGHGSAQLWDANTGKVSPLPVSQSAAGMVHVALELAPGATATVVLGADVAHE